MDTLDDIAKDLDEMAATLDRVDEGEYWVDTPADIAEILTGSPGYRRLFNRQEGSGSFDQKPELN